jgi:hypothetical protein
VFQYISRPLFSPITSERHDPPEREMDRLSRVGRNYIIIFIIYLMMALVYSLSGSASTYAIELYKKSLGLKFEPLFRPAIFFHFLVLGLLMTSFIRVASSAISPSMVRYLYYQIIIFISSVAFLAYYALRVQSATFRTFGVFTEFVDNLSKYVSHDDILIFLIVTFLSFILTEAFIVVGRNNKFLYMKVGAGFVEELHRNVISNNIYFSSDRILDATLDIIKLESSSPVENSCICWISKRCNDTICNKLQQYFEAKAEIANDERLKVITTLEGDSNIKKCFPDLNVKILSKKNIPDQMVFIMNNNIALKAFVLVPFADEDEVYLVNVGCTTHSKKQITEMSNDFFHLWNLG